MARKDIGFRHGVFAIVDTETTHASPVYGRIIEIAILRVEHGIVTDTYHSLVNPERSIQPEVELTTGISLSELTSAPVFANVAKKIWNYLDGAIFVAHNAKFDYAFLRHEFRRVGRSFSARCLDTVTLSKRLFPDFLHHDLSSLIVRYDLECGHRHRALDDARALWGFLLHVEKSEGEQRLSETIRSVIGSGAPANLPKDVLHSLPEGTGVYLLFGGKGELLYVGKSTNVRRRVQSHFSMAGADAKELELFRQTHHIETRTTSGELGALLLESRLIKELRPVYNRASRRKRELVVVVRETNQDGYSIATMGTRDHIDPEEFSSILTVFKHRQQAREYLVELSKEFHLCHKLLGLEKSKDSCFQYQLHKCGGACVGAENAEAYNARFESAFAMRRIQAWPFKGAIAITERNEEDTGGETFLVDQWCLLLSVRHSNEGFQEVIPGLERFDFDSYKLIYRFLQDRRNRKKVRVLSPGEYSTLLAQVRP